jgi:periplasmic protein TonB
MESTTRYLRTNALFLALLAASLAGHVSLKWVKLATAVEPRLGELESGRTSVRVHLVAETPAPAAPDIEPMEPLPESLGPLDLPTPNVQEILPDQRIVSRETIDVDPAREGREPVASSVPPPLENRDLAPAPQTAPVLPPVVERAVERRPTRHTVRPSDVEVEVPLTVVSEEFSGSEVPPSFVSRPLPPYPQSLLLRGIEGTVHLLVTIDRTGRVTQAEVHQSSGYAEMDDSALRTVRQWIFTPARRGRTAIEKTVIVPVQFTIRARRS